MAIANAQSRASGIYAYAEGLANRVVSSDTRQNFYDTISSFSRDQPLLASFLFTQLLLSFVPIALFASFALGTIIFAFITALLFSLFWIGAALLLLIPTLFVTVSLAIATWIWAVSSFLIARWVYAKVPIGVKGHVEVGVPNGKTVVVNKSGEGYGDVDSKVL